jgi:hypothetical protein
MVSTQLKAANLLKIHELTDQQWFEQFEVLEDPLTKCLLLVAVMSSYQIIDTKESLHFKQFLIVG